MHILKTVQTASLAVIYFENDHQGVEWVIVPRDDESNISLPSRRKTDSLIQVKLVGDDYPKGFVTGSTMRNGESVQNLRFDHFEIAEDENNVIISTYLQDSSHASYIHWAAIGKQKPVVETKVSVIADKHIAVAIEMLSSISLSCLSPLKNGTSTGALSLTRFRSKWAMEGRPETESIETMQLEPSWKPSGVGLVKFGVLGSMPTRGWLPELYVSDNCNKRTWGVQLTAPSSWEMEAYRLDTDLCLAGGIADRDFGHWLKKLNPGEKYTTPIARCAVVVGDWQSCVAVLVNSSYRSQQDTEKSLPIQYNDFCMSWGEQQEDKLRAQLRPAQDLGVKYFVIDAGWYGERGKPWGIDIGDWKVSHDRFPSGLDTLCRTIRERGMIPGIWFEIENVGRAAAAFNQTDHLLQRDGMPLTVGDRRFWRMTDPWVWQYLDTRVLSFLKEHQFGYLKIDYNENFGIGADGHESLGETTRTQIEGTLAYIDHLHREMPDLIIENCASGGHRLTPAYTQRTSLSSFSDDHEAPSLPIIAANVQLHVSPDVELIWAVLHVGDSLQRIDYSLAAAMMGRVCLSGDLSQLTSRQLTEIKRGLVFYQRLKPIIQQGVSRRLTPTSFSYEAPSGVQALLREDVAKMHKVLYLHGFANPSPVQFLVGQNFQISEIFGDIPAISLNSGQLTCNFTSPFSAAVVLLKRRR